MRTRILTEYEAAALTAANEANCAAWFADGMEPWPRANVTRGPAYIAVCTDVPFFFNGVFCARLNDAGLDAEIDRILAPFVEAGVPALWWVEPGTTLHSLAESLEARGLRRLSRKPAGMAVHVAALPDRVPPVENFRIERASCAADLDTFGRVMAAGFGAPESIGPEVASWLAAADHGAGAAFQPYLGWLGDEPVATGARLTAAGVAGISDIATLPRARGRGIGAAMTLAPCLEARARGYAIAVLQASVSGRPVYEHMGFATHCHFVQHLLQPR